MTLRRSIFLALAAVGVSLVAGDRSAGGSMDEDPPKAPQQSPPPALADEPGTESDSPRASATTAHEFVRRQLERSRERTIRLERALRLLEQGRSLADIRAEVPDLGLPGRGPTPGGQRGPRGSGRDRLDDRLEDFEQLDRPLPEDSGMGARPPRGTEGTAAPGPPGAAGEDPAPDLGSEQEAFMDVFLESASPRTLMSFQELRRRDPEAARAKFREMFPRVRFLFELRSRDPEMFRLRLLDIRYAREAIEAARRIAAYERRGEAGVELDGARASLRKSLDEQFRVRGEILIAEVSRMRKRLDEAVKEIEKRGDSKDRVVSQAAIRLVDRAKQRNTDAGPDDRRDGEPRPRHAPRRGERPGTPD